MLSKQKTAQRFGRVVKSYPGFGELRRQTKKPNQEIFYLLIDFSSEGEAVFRSLNNATNEQISDYIRSIASFIGRSLAQEDGEYILDRCYVELNQRLNTDAKETNK